MYRFFLQTADGAFNIQFQKKRVFQTSAKC